MAITNKTQELKSKSDEIIDFIKTIPYSKVDDYIDALKALGIIDNVIMLPIAVSVGYRWVIR